MSLGHVCLNVVAEWPHSDAGQWSVLKLAENRSFLYASIVFIWPAYGHWSMRHAQPLQQKKKKSRLWKIGVKNHPRLQNWNFETTFSELNCLNGVISAILPAEWAFFFQTNNKCLLFVDNLNNGTGVGYGWEKCNSTDERNLKIATAIEELSQFWCALIFFIDFSFFWLQLILRFLTCL